MTLFELIQTKRTPFKSWTETGLVAPQTLKQVKPGKRATVSGFSPQLSPARKRQLQAYGVIPGRLVQICQHSPVTVLRVEQTEIALEGGLADDIFVKE